MRPSKNEIHDFLFRQFAKTKSFDGSSTLRSAAGVMLMHIGQDTLIAPDISCSN